MTEPVRALVAHAALRANADRLRAAGAVYADLRRDAWGHGLAVCAETVTAAGLRVLVDVGALSAGAVALAPGAEIAEPRTLWGLPGGDGRPVLSLVGRLLSTKTLRAGEGVSYGYTFRAARDTVVGLVAGGYAQGVVREVGNRAWVRVGAHRLPIVGRVAMDACVIEIGDAHTAPGADVVFFGDPGRGEPSLADWEAATGMRAAEMVSLAGARASREDVR
jgi:alanine racemase